jgi:hypothetical protein
MRPLTGTWRMAMRFELLARAQDATRFKPVSGGDLRRWITPTNPTLGQRPDDQWIVDKPVVDLPAPAAYRFRVTFRWTGRHNRVLGEATRSAGVCQQPELRPDLLVRQVTVFATADSAVDDYLAVIGNGGSTAAGPFQVIFSAGASDQARSVPRLGAHGSVRLRFTGPACDSAAPPAITIDPGERVDDFDRANNFQTVSCANVQPAGSDPRAPSRLSRR